MSRSPSRPKMKEPLAIKGVLGPILESAGLKAAVERQRIVREWTQIVSPAVARHAAAERVSGTILYVATDSSVWMNELAAIKMVLLEKINSRLGPGTPPITDIRFAQRSTIGSAPDEPARQEDTPLTDDELADVEETLSPVKDEELRSILRNILRKDLQLKRQRSRSFSSRIRS